MLAHCGCPPPQQHVFVLPHRARGPHRGVPRGAVRAVHALRPAAVVAAGRRGGGQQARHRPQV